MKRPIPAYVDEMIEGAVSRLNNIKNDNTVSFAFITDIHNCIDYTERAMYAAKKINKQFPLAFCCLGGDYLCNNSSTTKACAVAQHKEMRASLENLGNVPPTMIIKGNHDDNSFGDLKNVISDRELHGLLFEHNKIFIGDKEAPNAAYGYYDIPKEKLRAIYLDSMDITYETDENGIVTGMNPISLSFGNRQLNWFATEALKLPHKDWSVVILSHTMPIATPLMYDRPFGGEALWEILCAFKRGGSYKAKAEKNGAFYDIACDFSYQGAGDVIAFITGHEHADRTQKIDGIRVITAAAAASDNFGSGMCDNGRIQKKTRGSGEESA